MTKKLARRWLNQNKWNIAKWNIGFFKEGMTQFRLQYMTCKQTIDDILF